MSGKLHYYELPEPIEAKAGETVQIEIPKEVIKASWDESND